MGLELEIRLRIEESCLESTNSEKFGQLKHE